MTEAGNANDNSGRNAENAAEQNQRERARDDQSTKDEGERNRQADVPELD